MTARERRPVYLFGFWSQARCVVAHVGGKARIRHCNAVNLNVKPHPDVVVQPFSQNQRLAHISTLNVRLYKLRTNYYILSLQSSCLRMISTLRQH